MKGVTTAEDSMVAFDTVAASFKAAAAGADAGALAAAKVRYYYFLCHFMTEFFTNFIFIHHRKNNDL